MNFTSRLKFLLNKPIIESDQLKVVQNQKEYNNELSAKLFDSNERGDFFVYCMYMASQFISIDLIYSKSERKFLSNYLTQIFGVEIAKEGEALISFFREENSRKNLNYSFTKGLNFEYDSSQHKLFVNSRSGKVIEAPEVLQIAYQAKTILTYRQKIELTALLIGISRRTRIHNESNKNLISSGAYVIDIEVWKIIESFAMYLGLEEKTIHFLIDKKPYSNKQKYRLTKQDVFDSTYFLDIHYTTKKVKINEDNASPSFEHLLFKHQKKENDKQGSYLEEIKKNLSSKSLEKLEQLIVQQEIFNNELTAKFKPTEITYQRYNKAFQLAHSFGVANILDINRIESSNVNQKTIKEKIIFHERLLQEMEEINAALKKLKGTLFEDDKKLKTMLNELDVLTKNMEKYNL